ncbi:hypothetical protein DACRYDRAFT_111082 [Dacryopinax primogenitus]|uniref:Uncharacterized protein n=1 Tax=Dacryopinax primogenitus (strain DJM 731) TaxID=1858805 RepID=M5G2W8_DACPD|nr:uncharacterized protein DACRYDRAFT_111082 [Dacryopinax primogenitus]EJT98102.1 hypothetical protein DACRYDRAFT_111082 [Dacryopinax primogenitus]
MTPPRPLLPAHTHTRSPFTPLPSSHSDQVHSPLPLHSFPPSTHPPNTHSPFHTLPPPLPFHTPHLPRRFILFGIIVLAALLFLLLAGETLLRPPTIPVLPVPKPLGWPPPRPVADSPNSDSLSPADSLTNTDNPTNTPQKPQLSLILLHSPHFPPFSPSWHLFLQSVRANPLLELVLLWVHDGSGCSSVEQQLTARGGAAAQGGVGLGEGADNVRLVCLSQEEHDQLHVAFFCAQERWDCTLEEEGEVLRLLSQRGERDQVRLHPPAHPIPSYLSRPILPPMSIPSILVSANRTQFHTFFKPYRAGVFAQFLTPGTRWWGWADADCLMGNLGTQCESFFGGVGWELIGFWFLVLGFRSCSVWPCLSVPPHLRSALAGRCLSFVLALTLILPALPSRPPCTLPLPRPPPFALLARSAPVPWEASYDLLLPSLPGDTLLYLRSQLTFISRTPETEYKLLQFPGLSSLDAYRAYVSATGEFLGLEESEFSAYIIRNPEITFLTLPDSSAHVPSHLLTPSTLKFYTPGGVFRTASLSGPASPPLSSLPVLNLTSLIVSSPIARVFSPKGITRPVSIHSGTYEYGLWFPKEGGAGLLAEEGGIGVGRRGCGRGWNRREGGGGAGGLGGLMLEGRAGVGAGAGGGEGAGGGRERERQVEEEMYELVEAMYLHWFEEKWESDWYPNLPPRQLRPGEALVTAQKYGARIWDMISGEVVWQGEKEG